MSRARDSTQLLVRPIGPADVVGAADVLVAARVAAAGSGLMPPPVHPAADAHRWFAEEVVPHREVWVAEAGSVVVGVLVLDAAFVDQLHVLPARWGERIGTTLLQLAMSLRPAGFELWVFATNSRARGLYEGHGMVAVEHGDGSGNAEGAPDVRYAWPGRGRGRPSVGAAGHPGGK